MDNTTHTPSFEIPKSPEKIPTLHGVESIAFGGESIVNHEILPPPLLEQSSQPVAPSFGTTPAAPVTGTQPVVSLPQLADDDSHIIADDVDVIEKEWVSRAKKIVSMTSNDPFVEAQELGKLKAAYMKKRFNKDLIVAVEQGK
jgi:hypothetical protein